MNNKFSENLKKIRKDNHLSQEQLADELGVSRQAISKWESANAYPEMDKIITLCEKFNLNIDDLLHKDIMEVKREEESKKNLNQYIDDFLNFITNTITMFSSMSFKSKCKCLFEQFCIGIILLLVCLIIDTIGQELLSGLFGIIPDKLYFILHSLLHLIYSIFAIMTSVIIIVHIYKIRYLDYYEKVKKEVLIEEKNENDTILEGPKTAEKPDKKNKTLFKNKEEKIIIRDPKHGEYKFINGLFKGIIGIIKFTILCFSVILFITLICLFSIFVLSFLTYKTGIFFIGLLIVILSAAMINIILILLLLNFVFTRKNDKKKLIWIFIISLITFGIGSGLVLMGTLNFEYIENNQEILKTEYIELDMRNDLVFQPFQVVQYIESNNDNIKIESTLNKYFNINHSSLNDSVIHIWASCDNPIKLVKEIINKFSDKKVISINDNLQDIKIYTTKENIEILKKNNMEYTNKLKERENLVNSYENRINELQLEIDKHIQNERKYLEEINELKNQFVQQQNNTE